MVSVSIEFVEDNVHSRFINTSLDFKNQIKLDIFNEKPPFVIFVNGKEVIFFLYWESYWWWDIEFITDVFIITDFAAHDILAILLIIVFIVKVIAAFKLIPQFKELLLFGLIWTTFATSFIGNCRNILKELLFFLFFVIHDSIIRYNSPKLRSLLGVFIKLNLWIDHITPGTSGREGKVRERGLDEIDVGVAFLSDFECLDMWEVGSVNDGGSGFGVVPAFTDGDGHVVEFVDDFELFAQSGEALWHCLCDLG